MAKKGKKTGKKGTPSSKRARTSKSEDPLECFYCGGVVREWNWRCPQCGKLFKSGKRAIAIFVSVIIISALIGTSPYWLPKPKDPPYPLEIERVTPIPYHESAYRFAHPTIYFDLWHAINVSLDRDSCERSFSIEPSINGTLYWGGPEYGLHIMTYFPNNQADPDDWLQPGQKYWINVTTECMDVKGNHLDREWRYWFIVSEE